MPLDQITIESANKLGSLPGYISSGDHKAGIIVLQEWWGANEQIKGMAERWYADKYITLVPDLYRGKVATNHEQAGHYFNDLDWQGAIMDIQGAVNFLRSKGCLKVGVTGFCMGGALSLSSSILVDGLDASAPFYGIASLGNPAESKVPLQLHFGTADTMKNFSDTEAQDNLEKKLKEGKRVYEFFRYESAGHGFANEKHPENYNKEYAELAHQRTLDFFGKYLN